MTPEEQFIEEINKSTNKSLDKGDYGFIAGTHSPYGNYSKGLQSASKVLGFTVWKKTDEGYIDKGFIHTEDLNTKQEIIDFLNS